MSAGNRKFPQRPPVHPEYNKTSIYVGFLVVMFIVVAIIAAGITKATAAIPNGSCASRGTVTGFGYVDSHNEFTMPEGGMTFEDYKCVKGGNKVWITKADTYFESYDLEHWARSGWKHTGILCYTDGGGLRYLSSMDEIAGVNLTDRQIANYERWALRYADKKGCDLIHE